VRTGKEPVLDDVMMRTGNEPVHNMGMGDSHFEDYPGDDFEKVGEYTPEETFQSPSTPAPEKSVKETPVSFEPRRKRIKTLACWLDESTTGPEAHCPKIQDLFIPPTNTAKTVFTTNPQIIQTSYSRSYDEQFHKSGTFGD